MVTQQDSYRCPSCGRGITITVASNDGDIAKDDFSFSLETVLEHDSQNAGCRAWVCALYLDIKRRQAAMLEHVQNEVISYIKQHTAPAEDRRAL